MPVVARNLAVIGLGAALAAGLSAVALAGPDLSWTQTLWAALFFALITALAVIDAATETVPDHLTILLVATGLGHAACIGATLWPLIAIAGTLLMAGYVLGAFTTDQGMVGSGDLFLIAGIAAWFGPRLMIDVLLIASLLLAAHCILSRRRTRALAPSLAVGAAMVWIGGPIL